MKNKYISFILSLAVIFSSALPMQAYSAEGGIETPEEVTAEYDISVQEDVSEVQEEIADDAEAGLSFDDESADIIEDTEETAGEEPGIPEEDFPEDAVAYSDKGSGEENRYNLKITEKHGYSLEGADIEISQKEGTEPARTMTAVKKGEEVVFDNLLEGTYEIVFTKNPYGFSNKQEIRMTADLNGDTTCEADMSPVFLERDICLNDLAGVKGENIEEYKVSSGERTLLEGTTDMDKTFHWDSSIGGFSVRFLTESMIGTAGVHAEDIAECIDNGYNSILARSISGVDRYATEVLVMKAMHITGMYEGMEYSLLRRWYKKDEKTNTAEGVADASGEVTVENLKTGSMGYKESGYTVSFTYGTETKQIYVSDSDMAQNAGGEGGTYELQCPEFEKDFTVNLRIIFPADMTYSVKAEDGSVLGNGTAVGSSEAVAVKWNPSMGDVRITASGNGMTGSAGYKKDDLMQGVKQNSVVDPSSSNLTMTQTGSSTYVKDPDKTGTSTASGTSNRVSVEKVSSVKAKSKSRKKITVSWKQVQKADGYEIQYSLKKNMSKAKWKTVSAKKAGATLKGLKRNRKYYIRVRAFRNVNGKKIYGAWSAKKSKKAK